MTLLGYVAGLFQVFKNPYCALCNGVSHRDLRCLRIESRQTQGSLSMIMNFNWDFAGCNFPQEVFDGVRGRCHAIGVGEQSCLSEPLDANATCNVGQSPLTMKVQGYLTVGCLVVSITCLLLHNVVFYSLPNLQNLPSRILKSLCWSLVIAQSLFLTGVTPVISVPIAACKAVAVTLHFFFLSAFFWMNVMSVDVWTTFSRLSLRGSTTHTLRNYSIYAWGGPFLISGVALVADLTDYVPEIVRPLFGGFPGVCWFANRIALGLFLYMPICLLLGVNMALFAITVCWLQRQKTHPDLVKQASGRKECKRLWLYAKLSTIMGLSWSFGMIASLLDRPDFWYPFILFNGLQGAFIFIMFDVKRSVLETLFRHYGFLSDKGAQKPSGGLTLRSSRSSASTSCPQTTSKI
ncbi:hypothetical protein AAG570_009695 [Ranatra chinensis]|uniref:G-protein coupled receptors family 2 profile 2 domain-containing protein n=1 Tax=Ranatra chinensis TaxID=642074 RepID=A0ABD0YPT0_9HEMI